MINYSDGGTASRRPHRRRWIIIFIATTASIALVLWWQANPQNLWRSSALGSHTANDFCGNIFWLDEENDAISVVATKLAAWGYSARISEDRFIAGIGQPEQTVSISRKRRTLTILLPGGTEQQFPLPKGFAKTFYQGFNRSNDCLLQKLLATYPPGNDQTRLKNFLAPYPEPPNYWKSQDR